MLNAADELIWRAMRLAEAAHRQAGHYRKAPSGVDKPAYFIHLVEVAWLLQEAKQPADVVAAGFLHDIIEDCAYTESQLAAAIENTQVATWVQWVSEADKGESWEVRNQRYAARMRHAPPQVLALSCADKTSNLRSFCRFLQAGHPLESFTKRPYLAQRTKFQTLAPYYQAQVPPVLWQHFAAALHGFDQYAP